MYYVFYYGNYVGVVDDPDEAIEFVREVYYGEPVDDSGIDIEEAQPDHDDYDQATYYNDIDEIAWENEQRELHYGGQSEFHDHWTLDE